MSKLSGSLLKGALVTLGGAKAIKQVILFQYNPTTLTRTVNARYEERDPEASTGEPGGFKGPPKETIKVDIELDAGDADSWAPDALVVGVHAGIAALEMLAYPSVKDVLQEVGDAEITILPKTTPVTLFVFGSRVVPVRPTEYTITEDVFDVRLNPIRAKVALTLQVLTYQDLGGVESAGGGLYLAHHMAKERLAQINTIMGGAKAVGSLLKPAIKG
jgi:hypothetical protein